MEKSNTSLRLFFSFCKKQKFYISTFVLICFITGIMPSVDSYLIKKVIDSIELVGDENAHNLMHTMTYWIIIFAIWVEGNNIFWRLYDYIYLKFMPIVKGNIIEELYDYTQRHYHKFFQENLAGNITNRITEASRAFELLFSKLTENIVRKLSLVIFALITLYLVNPIFGLIFFTWLIIFTMINIVFFTKINRYSMIYAKSKATLAGKLVDSISNISAIRMFTAHKFERQYLANYVGDSIKNEQELQLFWLKLRYILGLSCNIMIIAIFYYICILRSKLIITTGDCVLIISLCFTILSDMWNLNQEVGDMFEEVGVFNQSLSLVEPYTQQDTENAHPLVIKSGKIEFKNVTFNYRHYNVFTKETITINGREKVGLVGFSGSGKTTFVNLIIRLYDIDEGEILIDGQDIKNITQDSLRKNISFIPQEPMLFHRTIKENISYGLTNASDEQIIEAAKKAYAHDFIMNMQEGYDTLCGERGNNLSGGQRQRIVIARAILKNAPILILDEATSGLDSLTEIQLQESFKNLMLNKTALVIAHRLSTILNMDRIIVFNKGKVEAEGTHQELIKKSEIYKQLCKSQELIKEEK